MIFVNFKTYPETTGENAISVAGKIIKASEESGVPAILCPNQEDLEEVAKINGAVVWAQHVDPDERGRATGMVPPEIVQETGAVGTLLNHSEHKLPFDVLKSTMRRCNEVGLKSLIFADSLEEAKQVADLNPDFVGYEPPELVGSKTASVSSEKPEVVEAVVKAIKIPVIIGAGVHTVEDIKVGLKLGAVGFAVASGIVLSGDSGEAFRRLAEGYRI
jgi:triosephosphate isomerase